LSYRKLLNKDIKLYRELQWEKQDGVCPICNLEIPLDEAVLDHSHDSGHCRRVLHKGCNSYEGKIKNAFSRYIGFKNCVTIETVLQNLINYLKNDYSENPIHPTELTKSEKELKRVNKKRKTLTRKSTIKKYEQKAKLLRQQIKEERNQNSWQPKD